MSNELLCSCNFVPRSLVYEAEGEFWSSKKIQLFWLARLSAMWREWCLLRALWHVQFILCKVFSSFQINIFAEEVLFRLNITCKTVFISSLFRACARYRLSHSWQAITCTNQIWPDLAYGFVNKRSGYEIIVPAIKQNFTLNEFSVEGRKAKVIALIANNTK